MLHLLVDTSTWLDLAKRRDGQRLIVPIRVLGFQGRLDILVPQVVIDEFERNRPKVESSMTSEVSQRFKLIRRDLVQYGIEQRTEALEMIDQLAHQVPLIGAMTTRNFEEIREQIDRGTRIEPTAADQERVVARGLAKAAPFHRSRNSVADALLIEMYSTALAGAARDDDWYAFVTSNSDDFSAIGGDNRQPHADLAHLFDGRESDLLSRRRGAGGRRWPTSSARNGTNSSQDTYFEEEPRRLDEILAAEQEMFDRIWYDRSMLHEQKAIDAGDDTDLEHLRKVAGPGRARVEHDLRRRKPRPLRQIRVGNAQRETIGAPLGARERMGLPRHLTPGRGTSPTGAQQPGPSGRRIPARRAAWGAAFAGQPVRPGGQGTHGVGAALLLGARIGIAHRGRQRIQPLLQRVPVGGNDIGVHRGHPVPGLTSSGRMDPPDSNPLCGLEQ